MYALHGNLQEIRVCGVSVVHIDLPVRCPIESSKLVRKILCCCVDVLGCTGIVREEFTNRLLGQLRLEQVNLVEEENNGRPFEPWQVEDGFEEHQCLVHLVLRTRISLKTWLDANVGPGFRTAVLSSTRHSSYPLRDATNNRQ